MYLRARYYDPGTGRFTTQDGWEYMDLNDPLSLNLYTYCHNNPVMYWDPSGHIIFLGVLAVPFIVEAIMAGVTVAAAAIVTYTVVDYASYEIDRAKRNEAMRNATTAPDAAPAAPKVDAPGNTLPNQGTVKGVVDGAPPVNAGDQGKHVPGHNNFNPEKSSWPAGQTGVSETQEAWQKGTQLPDGTRVWDAGRPVGTNGETGVRVHINGKGEIHGYPVNPQQYLNPSTSRKGAPPLASPTFMDR